MSHDDMNYFDVVVAGGGIAGLASAELFSRAGRKTLLLERTEYLCGQTSRNQHGWFHFGSLYCQHADGLFLKSMLNNLRVLFEYYRDFSGMNLSIALSAGKGAISTDSEEGNNSKLWFNDESSRFIFLLRRLEPDLVDSQFQEYHKISWATSRSLFLSRHTAFHNYDWRNYNWWNDISNTGLNADTGVEGLLDTDSVRQILGDGFDSLKYDAVLGMDRSMNAHNIIIDLIKSYLHHGGKIETRSEYSRYWRDQGRLKVTYSQDGKDITISCSHLVQALGSGMEKGIVQDAKFKHVRTVTSPLLVVQPALTKRNFQGLTPNRNASQNINHVYHKYGDIEYSLIGDNSNVSSTDEGQQARVRTDLHKKAKSTFAQDIRNFDTYCCEKTELADDTSRNYSFIVEAIDPQVHVILPGKFTECFNLALETYKALFEGNPPPYLKPGIDSHSAIANKYVQPLKHQTIAEKLAGIQV